MKTLFAQIKTSLLATLVLAVLLCGAYPIVIWAAGQVLFREKANGSLIVDPDGAIRGSRLLAQGFTSDHYFHPRPSSAGTGYDAANSSGSNLGPTSRKLADTIKTEVAAYREKNGLAANAAVPADAVTRSGSGLDPHISIANADHQAGRVARARRLPLEKVRALIAAHTEDRGLRILGEPGVNVLVLNRTLDSVAPVASR
jgi:potassium-transporting ATPase KdpC subunit